MQFRIREEDQVQDVLPHALRPSSSASARRTRFKTSFRVPYGQSEFRVGAFGLHGMSLVLMRFMHSIFGRPDTGLPMLGRFV